MNNPKTSGRVIHWFTFTWLLFLAFFALSFILELNIPAIFQYISGAFIIAIPVVFSRGGYHYVEIETEKEFFRVKHFNLFPVGREYKRVQVQWGRYHGHEVKKKFFGKFYFLYVYEQTARGVAKYPAIGLSAFKKDEREVIVKFFEKLNKR